MVKARKPHGILTLGFISSQLPRRIPEKYLRAVCLTDTPPEELATVIGDIWARQDRLDGFGLVFSRKFIMKAGGNPVIYLCTQPGNRLVDALVSLLQRRLESRDPLRDVGLLLPLIETFGRGYRRPDKLVDFHWEREWRVAGDLRFRRRDVLLGLCNERDIRQMERLFKPIKFIDPLVDVAQWKKKVDRARKRAWDEYLEKFPG